MGPIGPMRPIGPIKYKEPMQRFFESRRDYVDSLSEMMDRPQPVSAELRRDLTNLESLNRFFGSYRLIRAFLRRWLRPGDSVRVLDLCTGSADIPRLINLWARQNQVRTKVVAVDFREATLEIARERSAPDDSVEFICGDALNYNPAQTFDLVFCSLALHHFSDQQAERLLRKVRQLTRKRALVSDLRRTRLGTLGVHLLTETIYRAPMTRFDARLSMRRAFSFRELRKLAEDAGWRKFGHRCFPISRQAIWLE
jgi:SAM-dependent methyltransferase